MCNTLPICKFMDNATSCLLYEQTILPYFDYVSLIAESSTKCKIEKFQPLQNRAVKIILKRNEYVSTEDMKLLHNQLRLSCCVHAGLSLC